MGAGPSGSVLKSRAAVIPEDISYLTSKPVRQFISAGSANQPVPAQSVFRPLFIRGIRGKADLDKDGYVTGTELGMYLQKRVPYYETGQTPQYGKIRDPMLDEGNFVFVVPDRKTISGSVGKKVVEDSQVTVTEPIKSQVVKRKPVEESKPVEKVKWVCVVGPCDWIDEEGNLNDIRKELR